MGPTRIAQVVGKMVNGGLESVVMNYYNHIDHNRFQFDFFVDEDSTWIPQKEIEDLGGRIFIVPPYQKLRKYIPTLIRLFKENQYKIVHSHLNTLSVFPLYAAKKAGVPVRIAHSHSTAAPGEWKKNFFKYTLRLFSKVYATHYAACSQCAGSWLFGKRAMKKGKVTIFNNAIDIGKFQFDKKIRNEVRQELDLEGKFVIGHVGRLCYQKNQVFVVNVFEEVCKQNSDAVLMLIGEGPDRKKIEYRVAKLGGRKVMLLGNRTDVHRLYQAMDVFVFPSKYEGLGMAAVEAQFCGVKTIISDKVPPEAKVSDDTLSISIRKSTKMWANAILSNCSPGKIHAEKVMKFDIHMQTGKLMEFYRKNICEKESEKSNDCNKW